MPKLIEDYGLIGDGETAALVHRTGSIDWLCWPRFDSDACFAALLGNADNGYWSIAPLADSRAERRYQTDTLVLETDFQTNDGEVRLIDFMPIRERAPLLVRIVQGLRGKVRVRSKLLLRFDYGSLPPWVDVDGSCAVARVGPDLAVHYAPKPLAREGDAIQLDLEVEERSQFAFVLAYGRSIKEAPGRIDVNEALASTQKHWRNWIKAFVRPTDWPEAVRRSLITLKAMVHQPSGGIVAAPTTSLPEAPAGDMNWDYRYAWLRDATFTLTAFIDAGFKHEAIAWREWLLRAVAGAPEKMRIMYRVDGSRRLEEWCVPWLQGFRSALPVRVGNAAASQRQLDVFGELMDAIDVAAQAGIKRTQREFALEDAVLRHVAQVWHLPDQGLWEARGKPRHYVYSKASAWVAVDRYVRSRENADASTLGQFRRLRDEMHGQICDEGYNAGLGTFVEYYGGQELDASLLLLPLVGFLPIEDERIERTIAAIERELTEDGFVRRHKAHGENPEGTFLACSLWLAECQLMQGRREHARQTFERVLAVRNDLGLLSEEYNVKARHLSGNFPQALSHLALVRTALRLCGPVTARGQAA
jgi:GH15 family glucan-1,4-alpha-glucosidase